MLIYEGLHVHRNVCDSGATSLRLERTSIVQPLGLEAGGIVISWSRFW